MRNLLRAERCEDGTDMFGVDNASGCTTTTGSICCSKTSSLTGGIAVTGEYDVLSKFLHLVGNQRIRVEHPVGSAGSGDGEGIGGAAVSAFCLSDKRPIWFIC